MSVPVYAGPIERVWYYVHRIYCGAVLLFLIAPILAVMPLSFNSVPFFTYPMPGLSLRWYQDFRANPATAAINTEAGIEAVGYQCLKNGAVPTGVLLLERSLLDYPQSPAAHFGLGRAYRTAGREAEAIVQFREALRIDPGYTRAAEALAASGPASR